MKNVNKIHEAVDAYWQAALDELPDSECWGKICLLRQWKLEKEYVDRYGQRYPVITNIK